MDSMSWSASSEEFAMMRRPTEGPLRCQRGIGQRGSPSARLEPDRLARTAGAALCAAALAIGLLSAVSGCASAPPRQRWAFRTGYPVDSSLGVGPNGTVYVGSGVDVYALDGQTGRKRWAFRAAGRVRSSPAVGADGTVYVGVSDTDREGGPLPSNVYALDGRTGQEKWAFTAEGPVEAAPTIGADGTVYVVVSNLTVEGGMRSGPGNVYGLDGTTGRVKWVFATNDTLYSSPAIIGADGTAYVEMCGVGLPPGPSSVCALDGETGHRKWAFAMKGHAETSPAIGSDGVLYVGESWGGAGRVPSVDSVCAVDGKTGRQKWAFETAGGVVSPPSIGADGVVYVGESRADPDAVDGEGALPSNVYALDGKTGHRKWAFATGAWVHASPVIGAGGTVYVASGDGNVYAVEGNSIGGLQPGSPWPMFQANARHTGQAARQ